MNRKITQILLIIFSVLLVGELVFVGVMRLNGGEDDELLASEPAETMATEATELPTEEDTTPPTETEPEETEPEETEPGEQRYTLTFAGDCTFGATASKWNSSSSFIKVVGEDYEYPFKNVVSYFEADDFTIVNLEGPLTETGTAAQKTFAFKGPTAYTQILTSSSVEAVTLANNHSEDYGAEGYKNTLKALNEAGVSYVEKNGTTLVVTESGLKIGLYAASFEFSKSDMTTDIAELRKDGAEIVICAFHWGTEGAYRPNSTQEYFGRAAIEAGADIVYGSHPHVLQKVEQYKEGYIFYSMGNFSFGGSTFPQDYDSAILQMEVIRDEAGNVSLGELTMIPVSISSINAHNNYQPTPLEEGTTAYERALSKLKGTFTGPDLVVDYSSINGGGSETTPPTEGSTGETAAPTEGSSGSTGETSAPTTPTTGDNSGGSAGDSGSSGSTGGDSGSSTGGDSGTSSGGTSGGGSSGGDNGGSSGGSVGEGGITEG
ncbi:MAG: CapA family protein [Oscillospiraceae bacterium]|nr:CapA family protein [Oscillospiraceae bacterium]